MTWSTRPDGTPVRYGPVASDLEGLLHLVAQGKGMCFLPAAARDLFPRPGIRYVEVTDLPPSTAGLAWLRESRTEPLIKAVVAAAGHVASAGDRGPCGAGARPRTDPTSQATATPGAGPGRCRPRYLFRGSAMGPPAFGSGTTSPPWARQRSGQGGVSPAAHRGCRAVPRSRGFGGASGHSPSPHRSTKARSPGATSRDRNMPMPAEPVA
ncbi:LysR substrate-binding domain-containing protein [Streptomyces exfoliatus]|uniref:LysR substrate-binding domain-containing protein n=1 Tax=Streptomyces exfoliatus TaxID=1905 RepID=A0ABV3D169_STREX